MIQFKLSVHQYRLALIADEEARFGFADMVIIEERVKRYAEARQAHKAGIASGVKSDAGGCSTKMCRLGGRECDEYHGCSDTCRMVKKRITKMKKCPKKDDYDHG